MGLSRYANRRDANEPEIIQALEAIGVSVYPMDRPLDLLCGYRGKNILIEVKVPGGKLTPAQSRFWTSWRGQKGKAETVDEAIAIVQAATL